ncbi:MAG: SigE family RNA polymerase sigma factor [Nocardioides sp.]|uniref:RNA polymerase sigma factor n=1 Tax=Nocardioides sp. TaxID=35761 RepID=UPI0039E2DFE5
MGIPRADLAEIYALHRLSLVRLAVLLVDDRELAEDVVQDAVTAALGRAGALREPQAAVAYLRTAVVNGSRSALRRRRTARAYVPPTPTPVPGADDAVLVADEHREVLAALAGLAPRQREVLVLRYWSGLTEADIAETLGLSRGAVKSTASRGLAALGRALAAHDPHDDAQDTQDTEARS